MVYGNQGLAHSQGRRLGEIHPHQHRPDQPGGIGHRHRVQILPGQSHVQQRLIRQGVNGLDVLAGGNLRHHAAIEPVQVHLRGDAVRQHLPSVPDDGHGGFVAGGFHSENIQISHSFLRMSASSRGSR